MKRKSAPGSSNKRAPKRSRVYESRVPERRAMMRIGEKKGVDTQLTLSPVIATVTTNASSFVLNLVPPGTGSFNRVGRKIYPRSVRIKGTAVYFYAPAATTATVIGSNLRMVVVWDKQPSGVLPTFDTIFGNTDQAGAETAAYTSVPRYDNMDRFRVLKDCMYKSDVQAVSTGGSSNLISEKIPIDEYIKLNNLETVYSAQSSTQTIADISSGAIYVYFRAADNTASFATWDVAQNTWARLRYSD